MEPNAAPIYGTPAPYGRACSNCARAKARCVAGNGTNGVGAKCERCLRLNKDCQSMQTIRKRKAGYRPSASKAARLEEKLDGLYKLLQPSTPPTSVDTPNLSTSSVPIPAGPAREPLQSQVNIPEDGEDFGPRAIQRLNWNRPPTDGLRLNSPTTAPDAAYVNSGTRSTTYHCPGNSITCGLEPSSGEAEEWLNNFRRHMASYFPFIVVHESTNATELRGELPFLWLCIMSIASKSTAQQMTLAREIKITIGREMLVEGKNNIDLLLGLLVFVAWNHYHTHDKPIITQMMQLAIALVGNLGLNKPLPKEPPQMMLNLDARGCPRRPFTSSTRTREERRAVLGCFLLSSVLSSYFQRLDTLRWTQYLEECIAVLAAEEEHPSDTLLIHMVKLQLIIEKVGQGPWHDEHEEATGSARAPPIFYLKALQAALQEFRAKIPSELQKNEFLLLCFYSAEFRVHEVALSKAAVVANNAGFQRLDALYACLRAATNWLDLYLSFSPAFYVSFSMQVFVQMANCIMIFFRLLTFDDPIWDRGVVRDSANLSHILERLIEKFNQVKAFANLDHGLEGNKDTFSRTARTLGSIKSWWDAKLAAELNSDIVLDENLGDISIDCFDDVWLRDILGQGDGQFDLNMQW